MSGQSESEERNLPASAHKLREARKQGRVASSQDFVSGVALAATLVYLLLRWNGIDSELRRLVALPDMAATMDFHAALGLIVPPLVSTIVIIGVPFIILHLAAAILGNMIVKQGLPVSADPITPKLNRISPVTGFKRIFSLKSLLDLLKSLLKAALLLGALAMAIASALNPLLQASACGLGCITSTGAALLKSVTIVAVLMFLIAGTLDIGLQKWLFLRDQRMTRTERKREHKDQEGEPVFKHARRRLYRELAMFSGKLGVEHATVLVVDQQRRLAIGIRFVAGETAAPAVVCKLSDAKVAPGERRALEHNIPVVVEPELAEKLARLTQVGKSIPESLFTPVAAVLVQVGAV